MADAKELLALALRKAERRHAAVLGDLARISAAPRLLYETELLKSAKIRPYDKEAVVIDYASDPPSELRITLEPGKTLKQQVEKRFKLARRLMQAEDAALARLAQVDGELARLRALCERADTLTPEELAPFAAPARASRAPGAGKGARETPAERPYTRYFSASGRPIWVGRNGRHNDLMTFKHAGPHDQWLHASGYAGAHVVVPKRRDEALDPETLTDACLLAAHFSKAPAHADVEVTVAEVKFVRKFRGAKSGQVLVTRERHHRVQNEPEAAKVVLARRAIQDGT